ncbi:MAG: iron ABC transporter permease [Muribaculaceae bacterium]|nr:iron ABC transporter permease [Muribaculaceae bacterium]
MNRNYNYILFTCLIFLTLLLFMIDLAVGSVEIPLSDVWNSLFGGECPEVTRQIVTTIRLNKAIVAILAGSALSVSGLQMQTLFRNPLAGPYVLGISSGAGLGVAFFILGMPLLGLSSVSVSIGIIGSAWIGSMLVLFLIGIAARRVKDIMVILILGMMFSSGISAIVQILQYMSHQDALKSFVIWTMGSLGEVTRPQLIIMTIAVVAGLILAVFTAKPLNQLLLGEEYAITMGLNVKNSRSLLFISTTLLAGTVTAFCGPIGFIGLAMPHVTRLLFKNSDHRILVPANILTGTSVLVFCDIVSKMFVLPINAITALLGIPVIIFIVLRVRSFAV